MKMTHPTILAAGVAFALAVPALAQQQSRQPPDPRGAWSAQEMIGTAVRSQSGEQIGEVHDIIVGKDGRISKVLVEVGGVVEIADQHIGVPWQQVQIGPEMQWVQVPLKEVEDGTFSLFGRTPQGEDVTVAQGAWRVNELVGDYASLRDVPRYGIVTDVLFDRNGHAQSVIVSRTTGVWGPAGWYAYPYAGYFPGAYAYPLPYRRAEVDRFARFDYAKFARISGLAGDMQTFSRLDSNDDGRLSRTEYQALNEQSSSPSGGASAADQPHFANMDANDDGELTLPEAAVDTRISRDFNRADRDGDHRLSREEFEAALKMR
jgi:sporulation protein YlmC with PRC-barrel domain